MSREWKDDCGSVGYDAECSALRESSVYHRCKLFALNYHPVFWPPGDAPAAYASLSYSRPPWCIVGSLCLHVVMLRPNSLVLYAVTSKPHKAWSLVALSIWLRTCLTRASTLKSNTAKKLEVHMRSYIRSKNPRVKLLKAQRRQRYV